VEAPLQKEGIEQVIFGHIHSEIDGIIEGAIVPGYFNTGTWIGRVDLKNKENRD
jgi:UDP-2,3-diacylglucosamine pyrophosphatase LpxH